MKKTSGETMQKKKKPQFLKRPFRVMIAFNKKELRQFHLGVKRSGLSQAEFGRRKTLDVPIAQITPPTNKEESQA